MPQVIETLSKGFRRRVGLAQALLHDPRVLILDEPTDGLDPNQKHEVRTLINDLGKDKIIVISTHILEEVDAVCSRAIIISGGRLLADDTPRGLETRSRWDGAVTLRFASGAALEPVRARLLERAEIAAAELNGAHTITAFGRDRASLLPVVTELTKREGWRVEEVRVERGRLDEVFRAITTGGDARGARNA
jgi:ABC-2 type transport system ATP-binding protein